MAAHIKQGAESYDILINRFESAVVRRLRDKSKIAQAMKAQDEVRKKTRGGKALSSDIRDWRDKRCC